MTVAPRAAHSTVDLYATDRAAREKHTPMTPDAVDRAILDDLITRRRISAEDGDRLLDLHRSQGQRLARLLVTAGLISWEQLRDQLAERLSLAVWHPPASADELDARGASMLPPAFLRYNQVFPVEATEDRITLAMALPHGAGRERARRRAEVRSSADRGRDQATTPPWRPRRGRAPTTSVSTPALRDLASRRGHQFSQRIDRRVVSQRHHSAGRRAAFATASCDCSVDHPGVAPGIVSRIRSWQTRRGRRRRPDRIRCTGRAIDRHA